jgi:PAS domain S-box-containing protein
MRKSGERFPIIISPSCVRDEHGNIISHVATIKDITERKRGEEVRRESEERYRTLFEDSPISLWEEDFSQVKKFIDSLRGKGVKDFRKYFENHPRAVVNCTNMVKVIDINRASLELFKAKSKEKLQHDLNNTFSEESYEAFREELISIAEGKTVFESEAVTKTLKGDKKHVVVRWSVAPGYEKTLSKVLVSISDVTELKRAREQNLLLETSKALSRTLKLDQVLKIAIEKMAKALKADRCSVVLVDEGVDSAAIRHVFVKKDLPRLILPDKRTPPDECFSQIKEILTQKGYFQIRNAETDPLPASVQSYFRKVGIKSVLLIPLILEKKLFGIFLVASVEKLRSFVSEEISLAQTISNQTAVAIQNSLLIEDLKKKHSQIIEQSKTLERQYQEQNILMKISRELSGTLNLDRILQIATKEAAQALQVDRCAALLAFPEEDYAEVRSIYVKDGESVSHILGYKIYPRDFPQAKEMLEKRKWIHIPNVYHLSGKSFAKEYFIKEGIKSVIFSPMVHGKKLVGFFVLSTMKDFKTFTKEEIKLAQTIADQVAVAIENARLLELVRRSSGDLKALSIQLINIQEDERKKIAQELHDQIGQTLFAMKMNLEMTKKNLPPDPEKLEDMKNRLTDTENLLSQTIDQIRNLTTDLRPSMLDDFGLIPALNWYIDNFSKRTNIKVYLKTKNFKPRLSSEVETTFYRIIQEALTNVAKHAQATEVSILLARENSNACLAVEDNGIGFDTKKASFPKDRLGIFSIKERVGLLNGEFEIRSKANRGTKLSVKIPLVEKRV